MGQVTVSVADKTYRIACNDGQEAHLIKLAAELDRKINEMRDSFGEIGDSRLTVMAAITFMDDREEMKSRITTLENEIAYLFLVLRKPPHHRRALPSIVPDINQVYRLHLCALHILGGVLAHLGLIYHPFL